jgi:hypothetical protein
VEGGRERIFETTLDRPTHEAVCRIMARLFRPGAQLHNNVRCFWGSVDGRYVEVWDAKSPTPPPPVAAEAAPNPDTGGIFGFIVDAFSGQPLRDCTVRTFEPYVTLHPDERGVFALTDLPPGPRWLEVQAPWHESAIAHLEIRPGLVDLAMVQLTPEASAPPPLRFAPRAVERSERHAIESRLTIRVRDSRGRAVPRAHVVLARAARRYGGITDGAGEIEMSELEAGEYAVFVRATGHRPSRLRRTLAPAGREAIEVRLERAKGDGRMATNDRRGGRDSPPAP